MDHRTALNTIARAIHVGSALLFVAVLYFGRDVLVPWTLGGLLALLLTPPVNRLRHYSVSNVAAVLIAAGVVFDGLMIVVVAVGTSAAQLAQEVPQYRQELVHKARAVQQRLRSWGVNWSEMAEESTPDSSAITASGLLQDAPASHLPHT